MQTFAVCSPSFPFPHPMAYQQLLSQQRGLGAFGHTSPLLQPPPTFSAHQLGLGLSSLPDSNLPAKVTTFDSDFFFFFDPFKIPLTHSRCPCWNFWCQQLNTNHEFWSSASLIWFSHHLLKYWHYRPLIAACVGVSDARCRPQQVRSQVNSGWRGCNFCPTTIIAASAFKTSPTKKKERGSTKCPL